MRDAGQEGLDTGTVSPYMPWPRTLWRHGTGVKHGRGVRGNAREQRKAASRVWVDVVGRRERQRQKLLKAWGHLLIESREGRASSGIVGYQCRNIHEASLAEHAQGARISI